MHPDKTFFGLILLGLFLAAFLITAEKVCAEDSLDRVKTELGSSDWKIRLAAIEKLEKRRDEKSLDMLMDVAGTRSEYWPVRIKAIVLLGEAQDLRAVELLLSIFNDTFSNWECPSIKSYTALALGNFKGNSKVVEALISGIGDPELLTREASIRSLGRIGDPKAVQHLVGLLGDRSYAIRLSAIKALEEIGDPQAIPHLQHMAEIDSDSFIRSQALEAAKNCIGKGARN